MIESKCITITKKDVHKLGENLSGWIMSFDKLMEIECAICSFKLIAVSKNIYGINSALMLCQFKEFDKYIVCDFICDSKRHAFKYFASKVKQTI